MNATIKLERAPDLDPVGRPYWKGTVQMGNRVEHVDNRFGSWRIPGENGTFKTIRPWLAADLQTEAKRLERRERRAA